MTRQQRWSKAALENVQGWQGDADRQKRFKTLCMKMPALIGQSGLVQALVFMQSRAGREGGEYVDALARTYSNPNSNSPGLDLLREVQRADLPIYLAQSRDLIEIATWHLRFAQSLIKSETEG